MIRKESYKTPFFMLDRFETYLISEKRMADHTLTAYLNDVSTFLEFSEIKKTEELKEINYQVVRAWLVSLIENKLNNRSVNRKLSALRTFFKWALKNGLVVNDPMLRIKGPKQRKRLPEFVKEDDLDLSKMNNIFSDDYAGRRDKLMLELFYQTGIRLSELIGLKLSDVQNQSIKVLGKRNKERIIPITQSLENELLELGSPSGKLSENDFVFLTDKGKKLYPKFVYNKITRYLSYLTDMKKRSPHVLRHTFATHMLNNGAGLETLKDILGHANLSATQVYTHNSFDEITKIYRRAHPRGTD
ncbi:MAG: tyrosine-type recombinase/integrase [Brumimicrobium sp.]|nr:tyrosine-type recombinase/integrase [Brumimicrobium sp.]